MRIRSVDKIENKIKELEDRLRPSTKYDINNKEIKYNHENLFEVFETQTKIDALKWCLLKKRKI